MVDFFKISNYFPSGPGGYIGKVLYEKLLADAAGTFGSALLLGTIYAVAMLFIFTGISAPRSTRCSPTSPAWREERAAQKAALAAERLKAREERANKNPLPPLRPQPPPQRGRRSWSGRSGGKKPFAAKSAEDPSAKPVSRTTATEGVDDPLAPPTKPAAVPAPPPKAFAKPAPQPTPPAAPSPTATDVKPLTVAATGKFELNIVKPEEPKKAAKITLPQSDDKTYEFPPLSSSRNRSNPLRATARKNTAPTPRTSSASSANSASR